MYRGWPFFHTLVDFMRIAETHTDLAPGTKNRNRLWRRISEEHESYAEAVLRMTGHENLVDNSPVLQSSIQLRNPYVDPLSCVQVSLASPTAHPPRKFPERNGGLNTLLLTISTRSRLTRRNPASSALPR